jgi:hypothetical protein
MKEKILNWYITGERGMSSESISAFMVGLKPKHGYSYPSDPSDFKRCLKLLIAVPEIRPRLNEMRKIDKYWNALIEHWKEVEDCFMSEVSEWLTSEFSQKSATITYALMKKIYSDAENKEKQISTTNDQKTNMPKNNNKNICDRLEICADEMDDLGRKPMSATIREAIEELNKPAIA